MPDPVTLSLLAGGLFSGGGSIAGGLLGQQSNSSANNILPTSDPQNNLALQSSLFDALNQIGFGDINTIPDPGARLTNQINALAIDEKTKRRGLTGLRQALNGRPITRKQDLRAVLSRVGLSMKDLPSILEQNEQFNAQQAGLSDLAGINSSTVLNRAKAAENAATLLNSASQFGTTGATSAAQRGFRDQIDRNLDDQEEQLLLQAQFGGFNPSAGLEGLQRLRGDADLTAMLQAIQSAGAITQALNLGLGANQTGAGQSIQADQGALSIAAQQANAANAIRSNIDQNNATSLANGVSGAFGAFGNALAGAGLVSALGGTGATAPATTPGTGPGSQPLRFDSFVPGRGQ